MSSLRSFPLLVSFVMLGIGAPLTAPAQATRTASKSADISVFAGVQGANPDYGPDRAPGGMFGVDFTRYLHIPVEPSLEFRANLLSNHYSSQHTYLVGVRAAAPFRTFKPYVDFLVGPGFISFPLNRDYLHDDSKVYSYGGGIDIAVTRSFAVKFDAQSQRWNTGEFRYRPALGTIGVNYTIPFRPRINQRDLGR